jgi:hypothetical protein
MTRSPCVPTLIPPKGKKIPSPNVQQQQLITALQQVNAYLGSTFTNNRIKGELLVRYQ